MPKIGGHRPVFQLYGPKLRLHEFPTADWRFLIHAAANAARAFLSVHAAGLVIGDVNHGNLVVARDGTVRLIDCDSFQVSRNGRTWFCPVGVGTHQPPETQSLTSYAGVLRTPNHDNFGLAVIIFQLLCMARHPFAGRHLGRGDPPSIEDAIARSRYVYSRDRDRTAMAPPPGSLPIQALTRRIQDLFEAAFAPDSVHGGRPTPDVWIHALQELAPELRQCSVNQAHYYRSQVTRCPWCDIEAASGTPLFPAVFVTPVGAVGGMVALWQQVTQVAEPAPLPPLPVANAAKAQPSQAAVEAAILARKAKAAAYGAMAMAFAVIAVFTPQGLWLPLAAGLGGLAYLLRNHTTGAPSNQFRRRLTELQAEWDTLRTTWQAPPPQPQFAQLRRGLDALKTKHDALPGERVRRLHRLSEQIRRRQLGEHLDRFPIASARISGIGQEKTGTLSAHGIDTAADIVEARLLAIPGFGPATVAKLMGWRQHHERSFTFDPRKGVTQADFAQVERDITVERMSIEIEVSVALARLTAAATAAANRHRMLERKAAELMPKLAQATADANAAAPGEIAYRRLLVLAAVVVAVAITTKMPGMVVSQGSIGLVPSTVVPLQSVPIPEQQQVATILPVAPKPSASDGSPTTGWGSAHPDVAPPRGESPASGMPDTPSSQMVRSDSDACRSRLSRWSEPQCQTRRSWFRRPWW